MGTQRPENVERANRALAALVGYKSEQLGEDGAVGREDYIDLLTDLRHFAELRGFDFETDLELSNSHYLAELDGE